MVRGRLLWVLLLVVVAGAGFWWLGTTEEVRLFVLSAEDGRVVWSSGLPAGTRVAGVPSAAGGRVVLSLAVTDSLAGGDDVWRVVAFDVATGRDLWEYAPPREERRRLHTIDMVLTAPHATADHVFVRLEGRDGTSLLVLDAATGSPAWTTAPLVYGHGSRFTDVVARNGRVLVPSTSGELFTLQAFEVVTGVELWRSTIERADFPRSDVGPFFAAGVDLFYVGLGGGVLALDAVTGAIRFRVDEPEGAEGGPIWLGGDTLYRRSGLRSIVAHDAATGAARWTYVQDFERGGASLRSFAERDGVLAALCACDDGRLGDRGWLIALDTASGAERWRAPLDAFIELYQTWPVITPGIVVESTEHDDVVGRAAADGSVRWRFARQSGLSVAADDRLVFASDRAPRWRHWLAQLGIDHS
jgi:outer membrane protein assembly factor BamB